MIEGAKYFDLLFELSEAKDKSLVYRVKELKRVLNYIAAEYTAGNSLQFPSLFARLDFIFTRERISGEIKSQIQSLRYNSKSDASLNTIDEGKFYSYLLNVGKLTEAISDAALPKWFDSVIPLVSPVDYTVPTIQERYNYLSGEVGQKNEEFILFDSEDGNKFNIPFSSEYFGNQYQETMRLIKAGDKLALLDVKIDEEDNCIPFHIIYEPDYLLDVSAISECFHSIGGQHISPWQLYFIKRLITVEPNQALLKGNVANYFLDELLYAPRDNQPEFIKLFIGTFKTVPLEYSTLFRDDVELRDFMLQAKEQFTNLRRVVLSDLGSEQVGIEREQSTLEPAFMTEKLGVQGRLDLLHKDEMKAKIIELKSGKLPFPSNDSTKVGENHSAQARMYRLILNQVYGLNHSDIEASICYSSATNQGENIRLVSRFSEFDKRILNTRNVIVAKEKSLIESNKIEDVQSFFRSLSFGEIGIELHPNLEWFRRDWDLVQRSINQLDEIERSYFFAFYQFISQELMLSKVGDGKYSKGQSALWNKEDISESDESDSIDRLKVIENFSDDDSPRLVLKRVEFDPGESFNFRKGDICVLYQKMSEAHKATDGQIFKCSVSREISNDGTIELAFRYKQNTLAKDKLFNNDFYWAIEHDSLDHSFIGMYKSLFQFVQGPKSYRELLLGRIEPKFQEVGSIQFVRESENENPDSRTQQNRILNEALAADDYYLLIGPPGTGKTSKMLKHLVRELYNSERGNIMVLAYTNRAVDEICEAINEAIINSEDENDGRVNFGRPDRNFIRIGSRLGTAEEHHHNLLNVILEPLESREQIREMLGRHRVFVSTVSSISSKQDLFKVLDFDTVIVDEASQILEPQIIGLLQHFRRFILIGDHKQLPAISLQDASWSKRFVNHLKDIDVQDLKESFFERLLRRARNSGWKKAYGLLSYQGRMHKRIATFPNHCFYGSNLQIVGLPHQSGKLPFHSFENATQQYLANDRLLFIPSKSTQGNNRKVNEFEAEATAKLVSEIVKLYELNQGSVVRDNGEVCKVKYDTSETIGIITPYRNQIARIKKELERHEIPNWESITVDTVERYQGSQKDIIILSLCVNSLTQLEFLSSNTTLDEDTNELVDRKLNVAITRAREQLIVLGNPYFISNVPIYYRLSQFITSQGGLVEEGVDGVLSGNLEYPNRTISNVQTASHEIQIPNERFRVVFEELIIAEVKSHSPNYPSEILGCDNDYNRATVIGYGRANFDEWLFTHTPDQRTLLYCYFNMRKHYFSQLAVFSSFDNYFSNQLKNNANNLVFFDWGCGPCTAGIALQSYLGESGIAGLVKYFGIDISSAMLKRAEQFLQSDMFDSNFTYGLVRNHNEITSEEIRDALDGTKLCIFNFSYFFGNIDVNQAKVLAEFVNELVVKYPLNKYSVLFQNTALEKRNHTYNVFKRTLKSYSTVLTRKEVVQYKNQVYYTKTVQEKVYYELLEL